MTHLEKSRTHSILDDIRACIYYCQNPTPNEHTRYLLFFYLDIYLKFSLSALFTNSMKKTLVYVKILATGEQKVNSY